MLNIFFAHATIDVVLFDCQISSKDSQFFFGESDLL